MRLLTILAAILALSCDRAATRIEIRPLAEGEWIVVDASEDSAVLQQIDRGQRQGRGIGQLPQLAVLTDTLQPALTDTMVLEIAGTRVKFMYVFDRNVYISVTGQPRMVRSPTDPLRYTFEHANAIWLFDVPDRRSDVVAQISVFPPRQLTRDEDLDTLLTQQREGEAILYWSTHPVWSADGRLISFLSNREAFRAGIPGQSLWMVDLQDSSQQVLFNEARVSVHTEGVLGEEFVFIGSEPGVFTVHPRTRRVTRRGDGYVAGAHRGGAAIAINNNGRLILLRRESTDTLPAAPAGRSWNPSAFFSPSGDNLALFSTDNRGDYTLHVFQKNSDTFVSAAVPGGPSYGPVWANESTIIFAARRIGGDVVTYRADLR